MPIPASTSWRVVQFVGLTFCLLLTLGALFSGHWTIYDRSSLLLEMLEMAKEARVRSVTEEVAFIELVLMGSLVITLAAVLSGMLTSCVIVVEQRWLSIVFTVLNAALFIAGMAFGGMAVVSKSYALKMTTKMLGHGIQHRYTFLQDAVVDRGADRWRALVDRVQLYGKCCGVDEGHKDYEALFPILKVAITKAKSAERLACVCRDQARTDCQLQHLPFSCCKRFKGAKETNPFCAVNVFGSVNRTSERCNTTKLEKGENNFYYKDQPCKGGVLDRMPHIFSLFYYSVINMLIGFLACVLATTVGLMAWKTVKGQGLVSETPGKTGGTEGKECTPSFSSGGPPTDSPSRRGAPAPIPDSYCEGPQRVSSSRLAPIPRSRSCREPSTSTTRRSGPSRSHPPQSGGPSTSKTPFPRYHTPSMTRRK